MTETALYVHELTAQRMIAAVRDWDAPPHLRSLFIEVGIDPDTLSFDEMLMILSALNDALDSGAYPDSLKEKIRFAAPLAPLTRQTA